MFEGLTEAPARDRFVWNTGTDANMLNPRVYTSSLFQYTLLYFHRIGSRVPRGKSKRPVAVPVVLVYLYPWEKKEKRKGKSGGDLGSEPDFGYVASCHKYR